jgi:hypothetical protein
MTDHDGAARAVGRLDLSAMCHQQGGSFEPGAKQPSDDDVDLGHPIYAEHDQRTTERKQAPETAAPVRRKSLR